jgi:putative membrane protein
MHVADNRARGVLTIVLAATLLLPAVTHIAGQTLPTPTIDPRRFIQDMTLAGLTEVQVGRMAVERATRPEVKAFATLVVRDQSDADKMLALTAAAFDIRTHTQLDAGQLSAIAQLGQLLGADFDRGFLQLIVRSHEDHVRRLGAMATTGVSVRPTPKGLAKSEPEIALWAAHTLPIAQHHLRIARDLQEKLR